MAVEGQNFMTKTQHYRKITKPLLERKRRARMNCYLDELKVLIIDALEDQGEHVNKLEKADILEMTVNYLKTQRERFNHVNPHLTASSNGSSLSVEKFREGFSQATYEVTKVFKSMPGYDVQFGTQLIKHLSYQLKDLQHPQLISKEKYSNKRNVQLEERLQQSNIRCKAAKDENVWRPW